MHDALLDGVEWLVKEGMSSIRIPSRNSYPPLGGAFSPNGVLLPAGHHDGVFRLWQIATIAAAARAAPRKRFVHYSPVARIAPKSDPPDQ